MAPEALHNLEFCEKTDVWSFGVTMWEIFTLGDLPYEGLKWDDDFYKLLENGCKLTTPKYNVQNIYKVMLACWTVNQDARPTFSNIKEMLLKRTISNMECETEVCSE